MKYIAAREGFGGYVYFQDNINDSPKWTSDKSKAMKFETSEEAMILSDKTGVYVDAILALGVDELPSVECNFTYCNWIVIRRIYNLLYTKGSLSRGSEWKRNYRRKLF